MQTKLLFLVFVLGTMSACKTVNTINKPREDGKLKGMRVAFVVTDGFEQIELTAPREALLEAGANVVIISPKAGTVQGYRHDDKGDKVIVDLTLDQASVEQFHALVLPGGVKNPDSLRLENKAIHFIKEFGQQGKPIAAICHGPWTLIDSGIAKGHKMTSWPSLKHDLQNAGAEWVDKEVVVSKNMVTSRKPDDIPAFNREMIELFAKHHSRHHP